MRSFPVFQYEPDGDKKQHEFTYYFRGKRERFFEFSYKALANGFNSFMRSCVSRCLNCVSL